MTSATTATSKPSPDTSAFRTAFDAFSQAGDAKALQQARAAASLAGVQDEVRSGDYALIAPLTERLDDADAQVRATAVHMLGVLAEAGAQAGATDAEARSASERAVRGLQPALEDKDSSVRREAVEAFGRLVDPRWADLLIARLADPEPLVRLQALGALQRLEPADRIRAAARSVADDPDEQVRTTAKAIGATASR